LAAERLPSAHSAAANRTFFYIFCPDPAALKAFNIVHGSGYAAAARAVTVAVRKTRWDFYAAAAVLAGRKAKIRSPDNRTAANSTAARIFNIAFPALSAHDRCLIFILHD